MISRIAWILILSIPAVAQNFAYNGQCAKGGQAVLVQNQPSKGTVPIGGTTRTLTSGVIGSFPSCTINVYLTGTTTRATIFSDALGTPFTNPFTGNTDGSFIFFAAAGQYDVVMSGAGMPAVVTITDVQLGATGGGGGGSGGSVQPGPQNAVPKYAGPGTAAILTPGSMADDGTNPVTSPNGFDVVTTGGYDYQVANNTSTGTTDITLACNDGSENAVICPAATSTTNVPIGFVVAGSGGTTGNAKLCNLGWCAAIVDNTATPGHFAVESSTVDGQLHDIGTAQVGGQANFFIFSANTGAGTPAKIRLLIASDFQSAGGGMANPMMLLGDIIRGAALGSPVRLGGPTTPNSVPQVLTSTPAGGVATSPFWTPQGIVPNAQTGTTYLVAATDRLGYLTFSNGSPIAVTLPQAGTAGFDNNFVFEACSIGTGTTTITPTTSTISYTTGTAYVSGAANIALVTGHCALIRSDNADYFATTDTASSGGSVSNVTIAGTANQVTASGTCAITTTGTCTLSLPTTVILGTDNSAAGFLQAANSGAAAHTLWGSGATTSNTILGFATVPTTGHLIDCTVTSTTCLLHDSGVATTAVSKIVATGSSAMGTSAITSGTCATVVTTSATGTTTTGAGSHILGTPSADPTGVTGYAVAAGGSLYIQAYPTADNVNWKVCNPTSGSLTPGALTINWVVF